MDDHTVIGRSLAVLAAVEEEAPEAVSLADIARSTGVPKPTVRRIAGQLSNRAILAKVTGGYRLGAAAEAFGQRAIERRRGLTQVRPVLLDLFGAVGGAVFLSACDAEGQIDVVDALLGSEASRAQATPWHDICRSPALLATAVAPLAMPRFPELLSRLRKAPPVRLTAYSPTTTRWFDSEVARAEDRGYAAEHEQMSVGWSCFAMPVPDGRQILSVAVPVHGLRVRPLLQEVGSATTALTAAC